ncbi:octicosapeptide/Phox/Bem1p family protein [Actinidia rufa]|uniref:Octicosapeptide/Phox/Bem1p family protein n=1 Tax=Actinidia rufa TaxID=165716 RepID=A0A7J0FYW5_9ERIC|nr:octicosapeptide/Phox/Bem1p family protein [Actinidia rufa]
MTQTLNSNNHNENSTKTIKFLYSYGGKILPRRTDGKLRYVGGHTRVLAVDCSITFADLDMLVSITCDEDLAIVIDEYDRFSSSTHKDVKIRAVLIPLKSLKKISPPLSPVSSRNFSAATSPPYVVAGKYPAPSHAAAEHSQCSDRTFPAFGFCVRKDASRVCYYPCCEQGSPRYLCPVLPYRNQ